MTKILVIEDEPQVRENIVEILELTDYQAIVAADGVEGVQQALSHCPDLILCDVMMPKMDGYEVLKTLRSDPKTDMIPLIFLTARADRSDQRQGMDLGADDYLTKPFTPEELVHAVESRLNQREMFKRHEQDRVEELALNLAHSLPHELNTPLNGIIASAALICEYADCLSTQEIVSMAEDIKQSGQRLHRLTQNFLLYSHLELRLAQAQVMSSLNRTIETTMTSPVIVETIEKLMRRSSRQADLQLQVEHIAVAMASSDVSKIVFELLDNALKFSESGTPITIRSVQQADQWIFEVSDRGRGFTPEQVEQMGAYVQFERRLYEQQGSGLGLAIAQRLAQLHQGQLQITHLTQPTTVTVTIPIGTGA